MNIIVKYDIWKYNATSYVYATIDGKIQRLKVIGVKVEITNNYQHTNYFVQETTCIDGKTYWLPEHLCFASEEDLLMSLMTDVSSATKEKLAKQLIEN